MQDATKAEWWVVFTWQVGKSWNALPEVVVERGSSVALKRKLPKYQNRNCSTEGRRVDCLFINRVYTSG